MQQDPSGVVKRLEPGGERSTKNDKLNAFDFRLQQRNPEGNFIFVSA